MTILLCILLGFALGWIARKDSGKGASERTLRIVLQHQLESQAEQEKNHDVAAGMRKAAAYVGEANVYEAPSPAAATQTKHQPAIALIPPGSQPAATEARLWPTIPVKSLDSVSILLYFGAFLMIAGVGLFVGLSDYSGAIKTFAVLLLALTFYGAGLATYQKIKRLRPAALTLTAIGLICLPLTGVAAYVYLAHMTAGALIWFVTSLASLWLYVFALYYIRQSLIGYLSVFMCLSLWLSISAVIAAPIYFFGWAMIILGMLYLIAARRLKLWKEVEAPLSISATLMVPSSLGLTLFFGAGMIEPLQQGVTILLAAAFYGIALWLEDQSDIRRVYFGLAYGFVPLGILYIANDLTDQKVVVAFLLTAVACLQLLIVLTTQKIAESWRRNALVISAVTLIASSILCSTSADWSGLTLLLALQTIIFGIVAYWQRTMLYLGLGLASVLLLPSVFGFLANKPALPIDTISALYIAVALSLFTLRHWLRGTKYSEPITAAYALSLGIAWLIALGGPDWVLMAASLAIGVLTIGVAYYERQAAVVCVGAALFVAAALQWLQWQQLPWFEGASWLLGLLGGLYYLFGKLAAHRKVPDFAKAWIICGLVGLYAGGIVGLNTGTVMWSNSLFLSVAGVITAYESWLRKRTDSLCIGGAVVLLAAQLALYKLDMHEWQLYWYMWALYMIALAYFTKAGVWIYASAVVVGTGVITGLSQHNSLEAQSLTVAYIAVAATYYIVGKLHALHSTQQWHEQAKVWSYTGLISLYAASLLPIFFSNGIRAVDAIPNSLALLLAGGITCYETYRLSNRNGMYIGSAVSLVGLQWLLTINQIHETQVYTHLWAVYFATLAWLAHRDERLDEKQIFTVIALCVQTGPLALTALGGDTGYGLLLLFESVGILLLGLAVRYPLLTWWGLSVAVASVLYQLRDFQFFVLVLLGAGIIGLGVYLLLRRERKT